MLEDRIVPGSRVVSKDQTGLYAYVIEAGKRTHENAVGCATQLRLFPPTTIFTVIRIVGENAVFVPDGHRLWHEEYIVYAWMLEPTHFSDGVCS